MAVKMLDATVASSSIYCFSCGTLASLLTLGQFPIFVENEVHVAAATCAAVALPIAVVVKLLLWFGGKYLTEDQVSLSVPTLILKRDTHTHTIIQIYILNFSE